MIKNLKFKISDLERGITLVEILVVIFIIVVLLLILVFDFPQVQKQFALSRATYKFAQDVRRAQDMALSGEKINSLDVFGYGVFVDLRNPPVKEYIIYADLNNNRIYDTTEGIDCNNYNPGVDTGDCIVSTIDLNKDSIGVVISEFYLIDNSYVSINFNPPNPTITISNLGEIDDEETDRVGIRFGLESNPGDPTKIKTVYIWKSGLVEAR